MNANKNILRIVLALLVLVGFFLPWFKSSGSGFDIVKYSGGGSDTTSTIIRYSFALPPLFALIVLIRSLGNQGSGFLLRALPFLVIALLSVLFVIGINTQFGPSSASDFFSILGVGYYLTVVASFLLMFVGGGSPGRTA